LKGGKIGPLLFGLEATDQKFEGRIDMSEFFVGETVHESSRGIVVVLEGLSSDAVPLRRQPNLRAATILPIGHTLGQT
jgi:hypothetical protein